ncbi:hypothetical protein ACQP0C_12240 [Nocardia sp. CA-129566]|uniref:poly(ethylene terephthalate) hydrolase family protein n=1 Tax=Nocardia sp. CA-129566 TaxID=3239976 RepID=UPI003D98E8F4
MNRWGRVVRAAVSVLLIGWLATGGSAQADPAAYTPADGVESVYFQAGPSTVTEEIGFGCCDSTGAEYDIWYPSDLGATRHPIVVWGNGTDAVPSQYAYLLRHLASWGFVVIATENRQTGSGVDILSSLTYLLDRARDPSSVFFGRLDPTSVGALGHSQGANGVLNAMINSAGAIKTAIPFELPARIWCSGTCADTRSLSSGSLFLVNGSADVFISPSDQLRPWESSGLQSNRAYYEAATVTKAWGTLNGLNHNDIQGQPDCARASSPCTTGVYGYLGYPTAWLLAELRGDITARSTFVAGTGRFLAPSPNWSNQTSTVH